MLIRSATGVVFARSIYQQHYITFLNVRDVHIFAQRGAKVDELIELLSGIFWKGARNFSLSQADHQTRVRAKSNIQHLHAHELQGSRRPLPYRILKVHIRYWLLLMGSHA